MTTYGDESQTMNMYDAARSSLYYTASSSSFFYSAEQSPTIDSETDQQPPRPLPPPSLFSPRTIELQIFEVQDISTSGMNEEEDDDDFIREWESE
jgi:serine incorporator 1/3